jgi:hypothetical protein
MVIELRTKVSKNVYRMHRFLGVVCGVVHLLPQCETIALNNRFNQLINYRIKDNKKPGLLVRVNWYVVCLLHYIANGSFSRFFGRLLANFVSSRSMYGLSCIPSSMA